MAKVDELYHLLLGEIMTKGFKYEDPNRKGTYRRQIQSYEFVYDFKDGFPAITTKKLWWKGIVGELLFFIQGDMDIRKLWANKIHIWDKDWFNYSGHNYFDSIEDAIANQDTLTADVFSLGKVYGRQWRDWQGDYDSPETYNMGTDQFLNLIDSLRVNPMSTSNIVTAWNPADREDMALPPCHWSFEILSKPIPKMARKLMLSTIQTAEDIDRIPLHSFYLKWHQRSVDTFLGLPFNIASYALLAHIIGKMTNMIPAGIIGDLSNVHIYEPHMEAVQTQLDNDINKYKDSHLVIDYDAGQMLRNVPTMHESFTKAMNQLEIDEFVLAGYESYPRIKAEMFAYDKKR